MIIPEQRRPWQKKVNQGARYNPDPHYQSSSWRDTRASFRKGSTKMPDGYMLLNVFCVDCYKESRKIVEGKNTDHITPRKAGGTDEHSNLQTLCDKHHAIKSANEGKNDKKN